MRLHPLDDEYINKEYTNITYSFLFKLKNHKHTISVQKGGDTCNSK